jgi:CRP-like cAMP-binding protein
MQFDKNNIDKHNLTEEELMLIMGSYSLLQLKANDFFLKEGQVSTQIGYVTKGLFRSYFYDNNANEISTAFFFEGSLIISFDSFNNQVPSKEYIKAIEDSELRIVNYERQIELYQLIPKWSLICKDIADAVSRKMIARANDFQTLSAAERYRKFCDENPQLLQRLNLGYIASYIGVDNATLSRIRKKK